MGEKTTWGGERLTVHTPSPFPLPPPTRMGNTPAPGIHLSARGGTTTTAAVGVGNKEGERSRHHLTYFNQQLCAAYTPMIYYHHRIINDRIENYGAYIVFSSK